MAALETLDDFEDYVRQDSGLTDAINQAALAMGQSFSTALDWTYRAVVAYQPPEVRGTVDDLIQKLEDAVN